MLNIVELKSKKLTELQEIAKHLDIPKFRYVNKPELIDLILKNQKKGLPNKKEEVQKDNSPIITTENTTEPKKNSRKKKIEIPQKVGSSKQEKTSKTPTLKRFLRQMNLKRIRRKTLLLSFLTIIRIMLPQQKTTVPLYKMAMAIMVITIKM